MTMVLVTHEMAFARKVADQILFMNRGRVWERGGPEILSSPQTAELRQFVASEL
jgi:polar amino acid transport system ATP-binding protein